MSVVKRSMSCSTVGLLKNTVLSMPRPSMFSSRCFTSTKPSDVRPSSKKLSSNGSSSSSVMSSADLNSVTTMSSKASKRSGLDNASSRSGTDVMHSSRKGS